MEILYDSTGLPKTSQYFAIGIDLHISEDDLWGT